VFNKICCWGLGPWGIAFKSIILGLAPEFLAHGLRYQCLREESSMKNSLVMMIALVTLLSFNISCGKDKKDKKTSIKVDRRGRTGGTYNGNGSGSGTLVATSAPSNSDPVFGQMIADFNQGASHLRLVEEFLSAERPQLLQNGLSRIDIRFVQGGLLVEVWDGYGVTNNDPFVGGFSRAQNYPYSPFNCYGFADNYGEVYLCGQPNGANFEGVLVYQNSPTANGVIGRFRTSSCLVEGSCM
jgi:hypothetical protein